MIRFIAAFVVSVAFLGCASAQAQSVDAANATLFRSAAGTLYSADANAALYRADPARSADLGAPSVVTALAEPAAVGINTTTTATIVADPTGGKPGTITIDTGKFYLYLSQPNGRAIRYSVGVGREGFAWKGVARVGRKAEWPTWTPPANMLKRRPSLPKVMAGGVDNPLGARALYLYNGGRDTDFRIHGTNDPTTVGESMSSGCIRLLNADVIDLYNRVPVGATVKVL